MQCKHAAGRKHCETFLLSGPTFISDYFCIQSRSPLRDKCISTISLVLENDSLRMSIFHEIAVSALPEYCTILLRSFVRFFVLRHRSDISTFLDILHVQTKMMILTALTTWTTWTTWTIRPPGPLTPGHSNYPTHSDHLDHMDRLDLLDHVVHLFSTFCFPSVCSSHVTSHLFLII